MLILVWFGDVILNNLHLYFLNTTVLVMDTKCVTYLSYIQEC